MRQLRIEKPVRHLSFTATHHRRTVLVLALLGALSSAGSAAAAEPTSLETQLAALKDQVSLLTAQQSLVAAQQTQLTSQIAGQILLQSAQTQVETGVLDKAKALALGKSGLEQAEAEAAFAQLKGIQTGLKSVAVEGNAGALSVGRNAVVRLQESAP